MPALFRKVCLSYYLSFLAKFLGAAHEPPYSVPESSKVLRLEQKVFSKANACLYLLNAIVSSGKQPVFGPGMPAPISKWPLDAGGA